MVSSFSGILYFICYGMELMIDLLAVLMIFCVLASIVFLTEAIESGSYILGAASWVLSVLAGGLLVTIINMAAVL